MVAAITLIVFVVLFFICMRLYKKSPLLSLPLIYVLVGGYTLLGESFFDFSKKVPFDFYDEISMASITYVYWCLIVASISYVIGFLVFFKGSSIHNNVNLKFHYKVKDKLSDKKIFFICLVTIFLLHVGYGFIPIYYREGYVIDSGIDFARILYVFLLPLASLIIPFIKNNLLKWFIGGALFIIVIGTSSRNLALIPACIFLGGVIKTGKMSLFKGFISGMLVFISVTMSLQSRDFQFQGVIPNIVSFFYNGLDLSLLNYSINYLTSYSVFASALTLEKHSFDSLSLYYSLTPLPSFAIDVDYMVESQKLNAYSPSPTLGILALNGPLSLCLYYFFSGAIFSLFGGYLSRRNIVLNLFVVMLVLVFSFLSLQYNLRGTTRILYYLMLISLVVKILDIILFKARVKRIYS